jgi:hypothetical protein
MADCASAFLAATKSVVVAPSRCSVSVIDFRSGIHVGSGLSAFGGIVLQNYFRRQNEQYWFKSRRQRAMLIQKLVRYDSIIASQRLVVEFCNTIGGIADVNS